MDYPLYMRIAVSIIACGVCSFIILSDAYSDGTRNWAYATMSAVIVYWLR